MVSVKLVLTNSAAPIPLVCEYSAYMELYLSTQKESRLTAHSLLFTQVNFCDLQPIQVGSLYSF